MQWYLWPHNQASQNLVAWNRLLLTQFLLIRNSGAAWLGSSGYRSLEGEVKFHFQDGFSYSCVSWCWLLAGVLSPSPHRSSLEGCLRALITLWLDFQELMTHEWRIVFCDIASEIIHHNFHNILLVPQVSPIHCGSGLHKIDRDYCWAKIFGPSQETGSCSLPHSLQWFTFPYMKIYPPSPNALKCLIPW